MGINPWIVNVSQHSPTDEQSSIGVYPRDPEIAQLLNFAELPTVAIMTARASAIVARATRIAAGATKCAMLACAPWFSSTLEAAFTLAGWRYVYAFSIRVSGERTLPDGSVEKTSRFKHLGWVPTLTLPDDADATMLEYVDDDLDCEDRQ